MSNRRKLSGIALIVLLSLVLWAFWLEPAGLKIVERPLAISTWPSSCNDLRVATLADLHVGSPFNDLDKLKQLVALVNKAQPDLVLLLGDYVIQGVLGGSFVSPEDSAKVLAGLRSPMGVYAVLGNHDWWLDAEQVTQALEGNHIRVLEDESLIISTGQCRLRLVGISDYLEGLHDVEKALSSADNEELIVAFTHNPDVFPLVPSKVTLTIAGHTHGGQVYLPGIGRPIVPSLYGEKYAIGHIYEQRRHLYVSSGVGTSILPVRFLVPPEVTVLTIHR
jgi:hypothetical protein